jgi:hypothetical protein
MFETSSFLQAETVSIKVVKKNNKINLEGDLIFRHNKLKNTQAFNQEWEKEVAKM